MRGGILSLRKETGHVIARCESRSCSVRLTELVDSSNVRLTRDEMRLTLTQLLVLLSCNAAAAVVYTVRRVWL